MWCSRRLEVGTPINEDTVICVLLLTLYADNLDAQLEKYLKKYFPEEVKEKQRANEIERGIEDYGPNYKHQECIIM